MQTKKITSWFLMPLVALLFSCSNSSTDNTAGQDFVPAKKFLDMFPVINFPYTCTSNELSNQDSLSKPIARTVISQFVTDSILLEVMDTAVAVAIYPIGKIEKAGAKYIITKLEQEEIIRFVVFVFNDNTNCVVAKSFFTCMANNPYTYTLVVNATPTFTVIQKPTTNATLKQSKTVWLYAPASSSFVEILKDAGGFTQDTAEEAGRVTATKQEVATPKNLLIEASANKALSTPKKKAQQKLKPTATHASTQKLKAVPHNKHIAQPASKSIPKKKAQQSPYKFYPQQTKNK